MFVISKWDPRSDPRADESRRKCRWQFAKLPVPLSPWDSTMRMGIRGETFSTRHPVFRGSTKELCAYCMLIGIPSRIYPPPWLTLKNIPWTRRTRVVVRRLYSLLNPSLFDFPVSEILWYASYYSWIYRMFVICEFKICTKELWV